MGRRAATLDELLKKPARTKEVTLKLSGEDGSVHEVFIRLKALGSQAYDDLLAEHPPTAEQKKEGSTYNADTFAPALIAACAVEPSMTTSEAKQIWTSDEWSRGEVTELFFACVEVCSKGLDVPFTETV